MRRPAVPVGTVRRRPVQLMAFPQCCGLCGPSPGVAGDLCHRLETAVSAALGGFVCSAGGPAPVASRRIDKER